jgi:hypothetical protein
MTVNDIMNDVRDLLEKQNDSYAFREGYYDAMLRSMAMKYPEVLEELIYTRDYLESKT